MLTGEPYKYRRTDDGRFVLYSVGWDEKDDGGVPGKTLFDEKQGDWVWEYPQSRNPNSEAQSPKQIQSSKAEMPQTTPAWGVWDIEALGI